jgi:hypothetical protein
MASVLYINGPIYVELSTNFVPLDTSLFTPYTEKFSLGRFSYEVKGFVQMFEYKPNYY